MHRPKLGKRAFVPNSLLQPNKLRGAVRSLKFTELSTDRVSNILKSHENEEIELEDDGEYFEHHQYQVNGEYVTVNEYRPCKGGVSLPRAWARKHLPDIDWQDCTSFPQHDIKFPKRIEPRDERQRLFFRNLEIACEPTRVQDVLANATTGSGKTVAGIYIGAHLRTPTLIVVDSNKIAAGWLKNFRQFFGQNWTRKNVGRIQRDECDYKGKAFVIAMAQSLASRYMRYEPEVYSAFGLTIVDEVQVFGGPHFSPILYMFNARVRLHLTAKNRGNAFGRLIQTHTGAPRVVSTQEVMKPHAYVLENVLRTPFYCKSDGALLNNLAAIEERNSKLAGLIARRGYERGRQVLALSNRTRQLQRVMQMCESEGVPSELMGIHAGSYQTNRYVLYYQLEGSNKRNRIDVFDNAYEAGYFRNKIRDQDFEPAFAKKPDLKVPSTLYNRLQAGEKLTFTTAREEYKPTQNELDNITHSCQIIFATYEIFSKGVDVPKLDMGVELLPSADVTQPLGRVLRLFDGKPTPEWYAIHDVFNYEADDLMWDDIEVKVLTDYFEGKTVTRRKALKRAGAKIRYQRHEN